MGTSQVMQADECGTENDTVREGCFLPGAPINNLRIYLTEYTGIWFSQDVVKFARFLVAGVQTANFRVKRGWRRHTPVPEYMM